MCTNIYKYKNMYQMLTNLVLKQQQRSNAECPTQAITLENNKCIYII